MSTPKKNPSCTRCGALKPPGRIKYCGDECSSLSLAERTRAKDDLRIGACKRCGKQKEPGIRGAKLCAACRELVADSTAQHDRERHRRKRIAETQDQLARGEVVIRNPLEYRDGDRWCPRCQEYRAVGQFPMRSGKPAGYCKPCQRGYNTERWLKNNYGLTWDEFDLIFATQDGRCAICGGKPRKYRLSVDHDHKTGEIRGLLCSRCNHKLLGSANDDPARLRKAADYLEAYDVREVFGEARYVPGFGGVA